MVIPVANAIPMQGGTLIAGIVLTICIININKHGVSLNLITDNNRQKALNLIGLIVATAGIISIGLNQTGQLYILNDVCIMIIFLGIQLGLCCVIHNTIVRGYLALNRRGGATILQISRRCLLIYPLVILVLIPIYIGFTQVAGTGKAVNASTINKEVYKPLNIALVVGTQILATVSDVVLLRMAAASMMPEDMGSKSGINRQTVSTELIKEYVLIWLSVVFDVLIKILIYQNYPVLFDSQISNMTLVFRAQTNLTYGLNLKSIRQKSGPNKSKTQKSGPVLSRSKLDGEQSGRSKFDVGSITDPKNPTSPVPTNVFDSTTEEA
ncbi:hypothetical protein DFJ77DRAFT_448408 [Powellomyces hirtus]|nr:hypothetical protein DFJ77DRAFT_448408 [Powellomyces hirtus]